jgi:L-lysine 2,3-aminomutase
MGHEKPVQRVMPKDDIQAKPYRSYTLGNLRKIPELLEHASEEQIFEAEVVGSVFPFKTNNYVVEELIDWSAAPQDPMYVLNFPQRDMLKPADFDRMAEAVRSGDKKHVREVADSIRMQLNPHPAGQKDHNVPEFDGERLPGMQHKYPETVLFFPSQGQTCHAYCSFCFRWPQFVGMEDMKFAMSEVDRLVSYLKENPRVSDVLFTGGDPMVMTPKLLRTYIEPLLDPELDTATTIRIGTKSLSYWPYKYVTDEGADDVLELFREVTEAGKHLAIMAHVNHPVELTTPVVQEAVRRMRATGAQIRSQTPILRNINDSADAWAEKWRREVRMGIVPYYMFVVLDTGAQEYFGVPLVSAWETFRAAYQRVSGLGRTVRGPSMSAEPGKVEVLGPVKMNGERLLALRFLQGRDPDWVGRPFFAKYDEKAIWLNELEPAFGEKRFWWEAELEQIYRKEQASGALFQETELPVIQ